LTDGIVLLDKPSGLTSFQALSSVKRALATGSVGHTGTLDRFASGLLVVMCGRSTRLSSLAENLDKDYLARVRFGTGTDTLDPEGAVVAEGPVPGRAALEAVLPAFRGDLRQAPPAYSAVHVGGRRAHERGAKLGELSLWIVRKILEQDVGHRKLEDGVAQEFEPLVRLDRRKAYLVGVRPVPEGL